MKSALHPVPRGIPRPAVPQQVPRPGDTTAAACCTLPAETRAVARARAFARDRLAAWHLTDETAEAASVVVSEFVTNTVTHSGARDVTLRLARCVSHVWIEVVDTGVWRHPANAGDDLSEDGRGLGLVAAMSEGFGVHRTGAGTHAWARLTAPTACPGAPP